MSSLERQLFVPRIFVDDDPEDADALSSLLADGAVTIVDRSAALKAELDRLKTPPGIEEQAEGLSWIYYPWRHTLVRMLGPRAFGRLRLDRNQLKVKAAEQARLQSLRIGIVGLSTGLSIALALAMEGLCAELRLADHDTLDLSNLNRVPGSLLDIGENKAVIAARRLAELDPYLKVSVEKEGLTADNVEQFIRGLDLVVEQCDSFDMKITVREVARSHKIPVLMSTNDRGLIDVERFDLEPGRPLFHGLLGDADPAQLQQLSVEDKAPYLLDVLGAGEISAGTAASLFEVGRTVNNWPQLADETLLGAASTAAAVRRFGLDQALPSGRIRIDMDVALDALAEPLVDGDRNPSPDYSEVEDLTASVPSTPVDAVVHACRLAPSGGNSQPWFIDAHGDDVRIRLSTVRTTTMDIEHRGSLVAMGAAVFNARVAAAFHGLLGPTRLLPGTTDPTVCLSLTPGSDSSLATLYHAMITRTSNRSPGVRRPIAPTLVDELAAAAAAEGGGLRLVDDAERLDRLAVLLAESDRIRYLTPTLHREMFSELSWPGRDRLDVGIDIRTLGLDEKQMPMLMMLRRSDVMDRLAPEADLGSALGEMTRTRVRTASALAIITSRGSRRRTTSAPAPPSSGCGPSRVARGWGSIRFRRSSCTRRPLITSAAWPVSRLADSVPCSRKWMRS